MPLAAGTRPLRLSRQRAAEAAVSWWVREQAHLARTDGAYDAFARSPLLSYERVRADTATIHKNENPMSHVVVGGRAGQGTSTWHNDNDSPTCTQLPHDNGITQAHKRARRLSTRPHAQNSPVAESRAVV
jgi:hypothetical protein